MLALVMALALVTNPVRAEPVEASSFDQAKDGPSTSSGRTGKELQAAVEAERAFAADAKTLGQWTAPRKWAAPDAVMFFPEPGKVQERLKDWKDPPRAIDWWPTASYVSCDGSLAVNTGGWKRPDGSVGYFTTVWKRQSDGSWRWIVDGGDALNVARPSTASPLVRRASCKGRPTRHPWPQYRVGPSSSGVSADGTLAYHWYALGGRTFTADLWAGRTWETVVHDRIAAAPSPAQP